MATNPDAKSDAQEAPAQKSKSKKLVVIVALVVLILAIIGGGWVYLVKRNAASADEEPVAHVVPKGPPTFFPMDHMVVNLADPGGEKVAQVGITLELEDAHAADQVKLYLPSIRSGILLLISQRTSEEVLMIEGKEKLAADILKVASRPFESADASHGGPKAKQHGAAPKKGGGEVAAVPDSPVRAVLFSSFIVQ